MSRNDVQLRAEHIIQGAWKHLYSTAPEDVSDLKFGDIPPFAKAEQKHTSIWFRAHFEPSLTAKNSIPKSNFRQRQQLDSIMQYVCKDIWASSSIKSKQSVILYIKVMRIFWKNDFFFF